MGLFSRLNSKTTVNNIENVINWNPITTVEDIDTIIKNSEAKPQVIFKHSTRCGISRMVLKQFETNFGLEQHIQLYYLDLLRYRQISNDIAERFKVYHQSPQLLVIKNGVAVAHESHGAINNLDLNGFI